MTSLYAPTSLFIQQEPTSYEFQTYHHHNVMSFIRRECPLFAYFIQTAQLENWFDSPEFSSTCFIPCKEYSDMYLNENMCKLSYGDARSIVLSCVIQGNVRAHELVQSEYIPTCNKDSYIKTGFYKNKILLNDSCSILQEEVKLDNGLVYILNGLLTPRVNA